MGRGNVCVTGKYEGLYFVDNDHIHVYRDLEDTTDYPECKLMGDLGYDELASGKWLYDEEGTMNEQEDIEECFVDDFGRMFPSFERAKPNVWIGGSVRALMESKLFYIGIEDNEWSMAVKLIQKESEYGNELVGLQSRHYQRYLDGMKRALLNRLPSIGIYTGPWTSGRITKEDLMQ